MPCFQCYHKVQACYSSVPRTYLSRYRSNSTALWRSCSICSFYICTKNLALLRRTHKMYAYCLSFAYWSAILYYRNHIDTPILCPLYVWLQAYPCDARYNHWLSSTHLFSQTTLQALVAHKLFRYLQISTFYL